MGENFSEYSCKMTEAERAAQETARPTLENKESLKADIRRERRLMANIGYLTTLQQLADASELDNLFDGQVVLGEEELLATYSLIDIINGNSSFSTLKPPLRISYDRNFAPDSSYEIAYESFRDPKTGKTVPRLSSIKGTTNYVPSALGDTKLTFHYDKNTGKAESATLERPTFTLDEKIRIHRNAEWLADSIEIGNAAKVDNVISIEYENGKPSSLTQTKYGAFDDRTYFSYDDDGNLDAILYAPAISVKSMKGAGKGGSLKSMGKSAAKAALGALKRSKWVDTVEIRNVDGVPVSTSAKLDASNWAYTDGKSKFEWNEGTLRRIDLEMQQIPLDDKKSITLEY